MPLVRFEVKNEYGLGDPELYKGHAKRENPKALLDGVAVAGLVGILRQLGDLAEFAADIFHDLHEQVMTTAARGHRVLDRIQHIEEALPSLEEAIQGQTSHIHFAYVAGSDWRAKLRTDQSHLLSTGLPRFMLDSYEECRGPPRLYLLDKFDTAGTGSCLKRYSDPSYFKRAWSASESEKAERVPREKKPMRNKRRGSRTRDVQVHNARPISRGSSSMRFASPSLDFSSEHMSMSDMRLKREYESGTTSSGSKTRLSFVEQSLDTIPSLAPDEELDKLSVSRLQINHTESCSSANNIDRTGSPVDDDSQRESLQGSTVDDDSQRESLQGSIPRSSSVTWDEKTEIIKPSSPKSCDDILVDRDVDTEALPETSEPSIMNLETTEFGTSEQVGILLDVPSKRLSVSGGNHFDEVTSETDNYMDALNTLESETETDSECQTKREVKSLSNFGNQMESRSGNGDRLAAIDSDSSDTETLVASHTPLNNDEPPESSESLERIQSPLMMGNDSSESVPDMSRMKGTEGIQDDLSADSRIPSLRTTSFHENTGNTSKSSDSPLDTSSVPSTKLWTNGGLFGVEPSKPPDFSVLHSASESSVSGSKLHYGESSGKLEPGVTQNESMSRNSSYLDNMDGSPNALSSVERSSLNSDQLFGIIYNVGEPNNSSKFSPSYCQKEDIFSKQNSRESVDASSLSLFKKSGDTADSIYVRTNIESQSNDSDQNSHGISSSFSGLAQRFLASSLQRRVSHAHVDISLRSGVVSSDVRSQETSFQNKHKEGPTEVASQISYRQNSKEKIEQGSFKKSISSSSHYHESSSPPLEHMKISFHPMNGFDTSKLKLEFPNVNRHESTEDLTFPSFQLVPGPVLPLPDTDPESDDDTFCRSSAYSSEDIHSPHSYSNSEMWEQEERSGINDHEIYDELRRISPSTASNSSFMGFEQMNHSRIDSTCDIENFEAKDDRISVHSGQMFDLPGIDSVVYSKGQHADSALEVPNEQPPPPPLPPMQWRLLKPSFASGEDKGSSTLATVNHFDDLQAQRSSVAQQLEQTVPRPPCITESMAAHSNKKTVLNDKQKLDGNRQLNHAVNGNKVDEREDLLVQIRNKAFNLRRIIPPKPSITQQPTTNVNVVAILEKANAIRQACMGSDEGCEDDDNWSDS